MRFVFLLMVSLLISIMAYQAIVMFFITRG